MTQVEMFFHVPGVVLKGGDSFPLGAGRVTALSFEQWQQLDDAFSFAGTRFDKARPAFWTGQVPIDNITQEDMLDAANSIRQTVHSAFLLEPRTPWLPSPVFSVTYCRFPSSDGVMRLIGSMEREWVVYGSDVRVLYDAAAIAQVDRLVRWLQTFQPLSQHKTAYAGLSVLERTSRPDNWWGDDYECSINDFVHCVAACEDLMLPQEPAVNKTDTFGRHAAALTESTFANVKQWAKAWSNVYRFRSELMHGQIGLHALDVDLKRLLPMARQLLRQIILSSLALQLREQDDSLPQLLKNAFIDPDAHAALHQSLEEQP
jgi:hypothetical protein